MGVKEGNDEDKQKKPEGDGGGPTTILLKVNLHCQGCALKVKRSVKRFDGVETVSVDIAGNKLTVVGKVDPVLLRERVEEKTRKKVELVSPAGAAAKPKDSGGDTQKPAAGGDTKKAAAAAAASSAINGGGAKEGKKPAKEKKAKAPQASTVALKIRLHCQDCIVRIRKSIYKIKGVGDVSVDSSKDLVTVKGTMDPKTLPSILKDKLKQGVEIVTSKKDDSGGDKKVDATNRKESDDGEKKKDEKGVGEKKKEGGGEEKKKEGGDTWVKKKDGGGEGKEKKLEGGGEEKKKEGGDAREKMKDGGGEEKNKEGVDDGGDKNEGGGDKMKEIGSDNDKVKKEVNQTTPIVTMNKMEYYGSYGYPIEIAPFPYEYRVEMGSTSYEYGIETAQAPGRYMYEMSQTPYGYGVNKAHAPQIFSDENPNACSIM